MSYTDISLLQKITGYIRHYFKSGNEHSVHSPFVFSLLTKALYLKNTNEEFNRIEKVRKRLKANTTKIETTDLGAGSSYDGRLQSRSISEIVRKFAKPPKFCRFLYRTTSYFKPGIMIELGTSLGISAMYQASGNPEGTLYTLEGCGQTADAAINNFSNEGYSNIKCIKGNFDDTLPKLLKELKQVDYLYIDGNHTYEATLRYFEMTTPYLKKNSVIIFDDINWSTGMQAAWEKIKSDKMATVTLDFFMMGMVFVNPDLSKQNFTIRL